MRVPDSQAVHSSDWVLGVAVPSKGTALPTHIGSSSGQLVAFAGHGVAQPLKLPTGCFHHILKVQRQGSAVSYSSHHLCCVA
jgi:hypothetical protein